MKHGDGPGGSHLEDSSVAVGSATLGGAIEVSVRGLDQAGGGIRAIAGMGVAGEYVEDLVGSGTRNFEDRPAVVHAGIETSLVRGAIEVAIAAEDQAAHGEPAVHIRGIAAANPAKRIERDEFPGRSELEYSPAAHARDGRQRAISFRSTPARSAVEVSVRTLDQSGQRVHTVGRSLV